MIGVKVTVKMHTATLERAVEKGSFAGLRRAAGVVRLTAARSIRRRKKASSPGRPPHTQTGKLKRLIRYDADERNMTAVIGPIPGISAETIWNLHEHGGNRKRKFKPLAAKDYEVGKAAPMRVGLGGKVRWVKIKTAKQAERAKSIVHVANTVRENESKIDRHYEPRPFMKPALDKTSSSLPKLWQDSVKN